MKLRFIVSFLALVTIFGLSAGCAGGAEDRCIRRLLLSARQIPPLGDWGIQSTEAALGTYNSGTGSAG